ncbi:MAG: hypothetical protein DRP71_12390 [Verrucomicrobia bacterium]|nr:MAG: hypothetical protein DRP71_12390 [Verrucomicrobiota bacterium]
MVLIWRVSGEQIGHEMGALRARADSDEETRLRIVGQFAAEAIERRIPKGTPFQVRLSSNHRGSGR